MDPVIYCVLSCVALIGSQPHRELARLPGGAVVVALGGSQLSHLYSADATRPPLLYFTSDEYRRAMDGLAPADLVQAIEKRRTNWSPYALDQVADWLYRSGREALALAAAARVGAAPNVAAGIDEHARQTLRRLAQIGAAGRFDDVSFTELLVFLIEKQALLLAELRAAPAAEHFRAEVERQERALRGVARILAERGRPEYERAPPHAEIWRAVFVAPADAAIVARLDADKEPSTPWRDGRVFRARLRDLPALAQSHRVQTLYLDEGEFYGDASELTQAQLEQRFAGRARIDAELALQRRLARLRLDVLLMMQVVHDRAARDAPALQSPLARALLQLLDVRLLAAVEDVPAAPGGAYERLVAFENDSAEELEMLAKLARRENRSDLEPRWRDWLAAWRAQISALAGLRGR